MDHRCSIRGFTLIELMIVVMIIAIMATLAIPMLAHTEGTRLQAAANLLAADISFAQVESITHSEQPRAMVFDTTEHTWSVTLASDPSVPITNPVTKHAYVTKLGSGRASELTDVNIASVSLNGDNVLKFGPYGELDQTTPATITLTISGQSLTVSIDPITAATTISE